MEGLTEMIDHSEINIDVQQVNMDDSSMEATDFSNPYQLISATFVIQKPEYKPHIFGILQNFSWPLCITIFSILITMSLVYYVSLKKRCLLDKVPFHTFAILLRQNLILKPFPMTENLLFYLWVVEAMFICLAYDSVFLSFQSFPPHNSIKDLSQLSKAILNLDYHCVIYTFSAFLSVFEMSDQQLKLCRFLARF